MVYIRRGHIAAKGIAFSRTLKISQAFWNTRKESKNWSNMFKEVTLR